MDAFREITLDARATGWRLDRYLAVRFHTYSRAKLARCIAEGQVRCGDRALKASSILREGQVLRITIEGLAPPGDPPPVPPVVYEDELLIAFDKPAGLLVHPAGQQWEWGLIGLARDLRPGVRLDLVHRLDRETSGVVVLTKDLDTNKALKQAIKERRVEKEYLAVARGIIPWDHHEIEAPIDSAENSRVRLRRGIVPTGLSARTVVSVKERLNNTTLVSCALITGRTHQIRVHMEHVGHPLLGDKLYGQPDDVFLAYLEGNQQAVKQAVDFPRHALHAHRMVLPHPGGHPVEIVAPLPTDLAEHVELDRVPSDEANR